MRRPGDREQTFEARAEQHFGSRLVEYERNMAERTWQEVGANRVEVTSVLEAVRRTMPSWSLRGTLPSEQRDRALRQTVRQEFDGYRAHILPRRCRRTFPLRMFVTFSGGSSTRVLSMPASTVKCLRLDLR